MLNSIAEKPARHPQVLCHRDFHGQNLHIFNDDLFLIDYQDLRMGPDTYDLASLFRDRGVGRILGDATELELLEHYRELRGADAGIRRRYFETLLQRSIKILGTFSKQPIVRAKMHYLDYIPPALEAIRLCVGELPEYASLLETFPIDFDTGAATERARELNGVMTNG
ncbi:MAG TPA: phosphotransferase [Thermoanaerobaculia bacterium]|nr:phosphotransferase [Thermoanaerobaculia bacterium]